MSGAASRDAVVTVEDVSKRYRQYRDESMLFKRLVRPFASRVHHDTWALRDVSFNVGKGQTLGVIGRNGAGKTTLLRLLSGVSAPTAGLVRVVGRRAPLIGIGVGFNQELTGRENVYVNGRLLGMTPGEVAERFDAIVDFAEIEEFIDVPVKFYSSGMFLRLAFSIAIHTEPEVMLVDEILAVGDVGFQAKCFDRMRELQDEGATVVVITHNLQMLQRLTRRTIVLELGRVIHDGSTEDALRIYHEVLKTRPEAPDRTGHMRESVRPQRLHPTARVVPTLLDAEGDETLQVRAHEPMRIRIDVYFEEEVEDPIVGFALERPGIGVLYATATEPRSYRGKHGPERPLSAEIEFGDLPLLPGTYAVRGVANAPGREEPIGSSPPLLFHVSSGNWGSGTVDVRPRVTIEGAEIPIVRTTLVSADERAARDAARPTGS